MIELPVVAALLVLEEFARQDLNIAKAYMGLPRVRKDADGVDWQVAFQDLQVEKVMREGLSEADQKRFNDGAIDTTLYTTRKVGKRSVKLIRLGSVAAVRGLRADLQKMGDEYSGKERTRRVMEKSRATQEAKHNAKYPADRFEQEGQTPPVFVFEDQEMLDRLDQECKAMELLMKGMKEQPTVEKQVYLFPLDEAPGFVVV